jgi:hypothetical protein
MSHRANGFLDQVNGSRTAGLLQTPAQSLYYGSAATPLVCAVPSISHPGMWWLLWPDGRISDIANLSRIKDAALVLCERGPPRRDFRLLRWKITHCDSPSGARTRAASVGPHPRAVPTIRIGGITEHPTSPQNALGGGGS